MDNILPTMGACLAAGCVMSAEMCILKAVTGAILPTGRMGTIIVCAPPVLSMPVALALAWSGADIVTVLASVLLSIMLMAIAGPTSCAIWLFSLDRAPVPRARSPTDREMNDMVRVLGVNVFGGPGRPGSRPDGRDDPTGRGGLSPWEMHVRHLSDETLGRQIAALEGRAATMLAAGLPRPNDALAMLVAEREDRRTARNPQPHAA